MKHKWMKLSDLELGTLRDLVLKNGVGSRYLSALNLYRKLAIATTMKVKVR